MVWDDTKQDELDDTNIPGLEHLISILLRMSGILLVTFGDDSEILSKMVHKLHKIYGMSEKGWTMISN